MTQLIHVTELLNRQIFLYNGSIPICMDGCNMAIRPNHMLGHFMNKDGPHTTLRPKSKAKQVLEAAVEKFLQRPGLIGTSDPPFPNGLPLDKMPPFEFLKEEDGFGCNACNYGAQTKRSITDHHNGTANQSAAHSGVLNAKDVKTAVVQQFFGNSFGSSGFQVHRELAGVPQGSDFELWFQLCHNTGAIPSPQQGATTEVSNDPRLRDLSPFLVKTQWMAQIQPYSTHHLAQKAGFLRPNEPQPYKELKQIAAKYLRAVSALEISTHPASLSKLNSWKS